MKIKVLVTGCAGFIGMHITQKLLKNNCIVICVDNLNNYYDVSIKKVRLKQLIKYKNFFFFKRDLKNNFPPLKNYPTSGTTTNLFTDDKFHDKIIYKNPFFCPDRTILKVWEKYLLSVRKAGSSCGAIIEIRANGVPAGLGAPIYSKLDADISSGIMSINAVKGVNIGSGMNSANLSGEDNSDEIYQNKKNLSLIHI